MQNAHRITDLSLFPKFWDEHWIQIALDEVDTRSMTPEQLLQFEMQLSANALAVKRARREREEGCEEGREAGREEAKLLAVRKALLRGKLTPQEIAEDLEVPLATVEAQQQALGL